MATPIITSETARMTQGQIDRACEIFRAQIVKHAPEFSSDGVQLAFGQASLGEGWFEVFRKHVERFSGIIVRPVRVNGGRTPEQVIDDTGCVRGYIEQGVLDSMPMSGKVEDYAHFFSLNYEATPDELDLEYEKRGLKLDPSAVAQAVTDDPAFADERPIAVQWRDREGRACCAVFYRWGGKREVNVFRRDDRWGRDYRFGGVRK
ncbi:MAG: hypothetical protein Q8O46_04325 [bacterium]|nr:hypothetical protein [bacterium]